ncbi:TIGR02301 family protein [Alkalicaulis satelles]|uniref:TIGR02301 family protein n=1 Tax=Alkalicaulis satelles TaxID=2609175 RepID=A0A5M6ZLM5_9PROT|nr:TIGR02301 family protein [Alkalicaulis satelles]KAA5804587.1 TIGR02301 family protein [Alkalicaulis satelles]
MRARLILFLTGLSVLLVSAPAGAVQERDAYPVESLARIMGELHAIAFICDGRQTQVWRNAMVELLDHEAPAAGPFRSRLIDRFNEGFQHQERLRPRCGAESEMAREQLAERGRAFSEQLRRTYLD